jgi:hypothetical protein
LRVPGHPSPEIVQWLAWRPSTGETFEALVRPRAALAPSAPAQLRLDAAALAAGETWTSFRARWEAFAGPDDVLCAWGHFPTATLEREEVRVPAARVDARVVANALFGERHGSAEGCARRLEELGRVGPAAAPRALGRGGLRMEALRRIVDALLRSAGDALLRSAGDALLREGGQPAGLSP